MSAFERLSTVRRVRTSAVVVAVAVVWIMGVGAPPARAATTLEVEVGYAGRFQTGRPVPVRVRVDADRLLRGELEVRAAQQGPQSVLAIVPVEVPGGSVKEFVALVPGNPFERTLRVDVRLRATGAGDTTGTGSAEMAADDELVGLLPGLAGAGRVPGPAPLAVDAGTARFAALTATDLALAPGSLAALDVIAATVADVADLDAATMAALVSWVEDGGHLLVDAAPGEDIPGLPAPWQPGSDGRARAGLGEVRSAGTAMTEGRWTGLIEPTPVAAQFDQGFSGVPVESALARDAGLRLPRLEWLGGFLVLYLLTIPITMTILRRVGRGELGWIVLPAIAIAFTAGAWGAGRGIRDDTSAAHATVLRTGEAPWARSTVGIVSRNGGSELIAYPTGWQAAELTMNMGQPTAALEVTARAGATETRQRLSAGEFGVQVARGAVTVDGELRITATASADDRLEGTVENTLPFDLEEVAVLHNREAVLVGDVAAGETIEWTLALGADRDRDPWIGVADRAWPRASGMRGMPDASYIVNNALWSSLTTSMPSGFGESGTVVVAGWTRGYAPDIDVPRGELTGRTVVVGVSAVQHDGQLRPAAVRTERVRSPFNPFEGFNEGRPMTQRFVLPDPDDGQVDTSDLVVRGPVRGVTYELWRDGAWQPLPEPIAGSGAGAFGPVGELADHPLGEDAARDGVIWLRTRVSSNAGGDPFLLASLNLLTLRHST